MVCDWLLLRHGGCADLDPLLPSVSAAPPRFIPADKLIA
jgi:hypothetical protein